MDSGPKAPLPLSRDRRGVTSLEYAIIGSIIVAILVVSFTALTVPVSQLFAKISGAF